MRNLTHCSHCVARASFMFGSHKNKMFLFPFLFPCFGLLGICGTSKNTTITDEEEPKPKAELLPAAARAIKTCYKTRPNKSQKTKKKKTKNKIATQSY